MKEMKFKILNFCINIIVYGVYLDIKICKNRNRKIRIHFLQV